MEEITITTSLEYLTDEMIDQAIANGGKFDMTPELAPKVKQLIATAAAEWAQEAFDAAVSEPGKRKWIKHSRVPNPPREKSAAEIERRAIRKKYGLWFYICWFSGPNAKGAWQSGAADVWADSKESAIQSATQWAEMNAGISPRLVNVSATACTRCDMKQFLKMKGNKKMELSWQEVIRFHESIELTNAANIDTAAPIERAPGRRL